MSRPRKAPAPRLEGAPPYVIGVYDSGPKFCDRYMVLFGWPIWQPEMGRRIPSLHFNDCPTHPAAGVSQWSDVESRGWTTLISWADLPEHLQRHVIARANYPDKVLVAELEHLPGAHKTGRAMWGVLRSAFLTKAAARKYARANNIILLDT